MSEILMPDKEIFVKDFLLTPRIKKLKGFCFRFSSIEWIRNFGF